MSVGVDFDTSRFCDHFVLRSKRRRKGLRYGMGGKDLGTAVICEHCGTVLKNKEALQRHFEIRHGDMVEKHACELCDFRTWWIGSLVIHQRIAHRIKKPEVALGRREEE